MAGRKSDFTLTKLDDLFSTQEQRDEEKLSKIRDIPLTEIDDFPDHPFKVRDDEDMAQLIESIKERGVITPATVRQKEDGRYELISGHRRKRACELAGFDTLRCEVVELNRDEATILMVESNYQGSQILPSEKAYAYKMRLEALSRQGKRTDLTSDPVGWKSSGKETAQLIGEQSGDSQTQVRRYIRLTNLVPELLDYVVSSNNKAFIEGMGGYSIYASSLDGSDKCVRLEAYMADEHGGKDGWKIEKCYVKDDSNREMLDIIAGKFFIAYAPIESEKFLSMPKELARKYEEKFKYPERFYKSMDGIEAKPYKPVSKDMER